MQLSLEMIHPGKLPICKIVQLLPPEEGSFHYRVKSLDEKHHRGASENDLALLAPVKAMLPATHRPARSRTTQTVAARSCDARQTAIVP